MWTMVGSDYDYRQEGLWSNARIDCDWARTLWSDAGSVTKHQIFFFFAWVWFAYSWLNSQGPGFGPLQIYNWTLLKLICGRVLLMSFILFLIFWFIYFYFIFLFVHLFNSSVAGVFSIGYCGVFMVTLFNNYERNNGKKWHDCSCGRL